jgi:hypothetical protein
MLHLHYSIGTVPLFNLMIQAEVVLAPSHEYRYTVPVPRNIAAKSCSLHMTGKSFVVFFLHTNSNKGLYNTYRTFEDYLTVC